jgi:hypothetical protein
MLMASVVPAVGTGLLLGWGLWRFPLVAVSNWPQLGLAYVVVFVTTLAVGCLITAGTADGRGLLRHAWAYHRRSPTGATS